MELTFYGNGCVLIATKQLRLLVDPQDDKLSSLKPEVTLKTTKASDQIFSSGDSFIISAPGEYEVKGVAIAGISAQAHIDDPKDPSKGVMYTVESQGLRAVITGNIDSNLKDSQLEAIGEVNLMVVPVGGHGLTLDATAAAKLVSQFEPRWVVPVHYDDGKTKYEVPQDKLDKFLHEVGAEGVQPVPKLKVDAKELGEETSIVVLELSS